MLVLRLPALTHPVLDPDEAGHAVGGLVWLDGGLPYLDFVDNKQPLVYAAFASILRVGRRSLVAVHWATLPWLLLTALLVSRLARQVHGPGWARETAAITFTVASAAWVEKDMLATNTEILANLPLVAAVLLAVAPPRSADTSLPSWRAFAVGVLTGVAVLFNLKALTVSPALALAFGRRRDGPETAGPPLLRVATLAVGVAVPLVVAMGFFAGQGALPELIEWNLLGNLRYLTIGPPLGAAFENGILYGWPRLALFVLATLPLWVAAALSWRRFGDRWAGRVTATWLVFSFAAVLQGGRLYGHYFIQLLPPLCVLGAGPLADLLALRSPDRRTRILRAIAVAGLVLPATGFAVAGHLRLAREELDAVRPPLGEVTRAVLDRSCPGETVFVWGYWPQLYYRLYLEDRRPASRFVFPQSLAGYVPGQPLGKVPGSPPISWSSGTGASSPTTSLAGPRTSSSTPRPAPCISGRGFPWTTTPCFGES